MDLENLQLFLQGPAESTNGATNMQLRGKTAELLILWIDQYHEAHFAVIREIYCNPGSTRGEIWDKIRGPRPREDSAEADLFRLLLRDLSTGGVIRQEREIDAYGRFQRRTRTGQSLAAASGVMESSFEDTKPYVLTELGRQFVHYVMEDVAPQLGEQTRRV